VAACDQATATVATSKRLTATSKHKSGITAAVSRTLVEPSAEGDVEKARGLLNEAHDVAAAHGYSTVERRATQALANLE
jgi:hypothetical protein